LSDIEVPPLFTAASGAALVKIDHIDGRESSWSTLLPQNIKHPERRKGWIASRVALQRAFKRIGQQLENDELAQLGHQRLVKCPANYFSLSHNDAWAGAWVIPGMQWRLGLDLEHIGRKISEVLLSKITSHDDIAMDPIRLWSAKEAVYKSLSGAYQESVDPRDIVLKKDSFDVLGCTLSGNWAQQINDNGLVISFAWSKSKEQSARVDGF
jgi:4'-phosphopantetheinyl transferase EntD